MNILCNPSGKKGAFRAIDWLVEHNNLYIKVSLLLKPSYENKFSSASDIAYIWRKVFKPPERVDSD